MFEGIKSGYIADKLYDLMFLIDELESKKYHKKSLSYFFDNADSLKTHKADSIYLYQRETIHTIIIDHIRYRFVSKWLYNCCYIIINDVIVCEVEYDGIRGYINWKHNKPSNMFVLLKEHSKLFKQSKKKLKRYLKEYDDKKIKENREKRILANSFKKGD